MSLISSRFLFILSSFFFFFPKFSDSQAETKWPGAWELFVENSGVSAMHSVLLPTTNKVQIYDATIWRISKIKLPADVKCRIFDENTKEEDCWAHSVILDTNTGDLRALRLDTDTWCSSGGLTPNGTLVSTGGFRGGANTARYLALCDKCNWVEYPEALAAQRWYSTQVTLPDGNFVVFGGRNSRNYEFIPPEGKSNAKDALFPSKLLEETEIKDEYNLYPHAYLIPDGNVFLFANDRSILLDTKKDNVVREFPVLPGGARTYPAAGNSALLPLKLSPTIDEPVSADVLICGGAGKTSFEKAVKKIFDPAIDGCARMTVTSPNPAWQPEKMPSGRVMGDTVLLPTGDVLLVNGAKRGCSGWNFAKDPNFVPVLYMPEKEMGSRFKELSPSKIPRMYHSVANLLPDGKVLVGGSNTNDGYLTKVEYPTELRVEKFSPPYLDPSLAKSRPEIVAGDMPKLLKYGQKLEIQFKLDEPAPELTKLRVTMHAPAFVTHSMSMNQRLLILPLEEVTTVSPGVHKVTAVAPLSGKTAPPGYFLLFVNYLGVPSVGEWIQIQ